MADDASTRTDSIEPEAGTILKPSRYGCAVCGATATAFRVGYRMDGQMEFEALCDGHDGE